MELAGLASWLGLLLRHAVNGAKAPDEITTVDSHHFPVGKQIGKNSEGSAVVDVVGRGDKHQTIGDIKISVAGRQPSSLVGNGARHGQFDYLERVAALVGGRSQAPQVVRPPVPLDPVLTKHRFMSAIGAPRYVPTLFGGGRLERD